MGKSSTQNQNQTTHQTQNTTTTPTNPQYVTDALAGLTGKVSDLSNMDPYSLIAGPDPLQTQAGTAAGKLITSPYMDQGGGLIRSGALGGANTAAGASLLDNLGAYMSPYTNDVVDTTLRGFDQNAGYTRAQDMLAKAGDTTFGGSGGAIQTALNEQNIAQGRASTEANLRDAAFKTGAGLSLSDAQLRQQNSEFNAGQQDNASQRLLAGGEALGNLGAAEGADARANIGTQGTLGSILQALAQAKAGAPVSLAGTSAGILGSLPLGLLHGQDSSGVTDGATHSTSTTTESDPLGSLGTAALTAAALFGAPFTGGLSLGATGLAGLSGLAGGAAALPTSAFGAFVSDRRAKTDIKRVGRMDSGLPVYTYRYKGGGPVQMGVMAQEAAKVKPHAVHDIGGLLAVNYGDL